MTAPGITVNMLTSPPPVTVDAPTGDWYVTGMAQRGPVGEPITIHSMSDYLAKLGARPGYASLYDALDLYFREGGVQAYVSRVAGPATAKATVNLIDRAVSPLPTLRIDASSPGAWGNSLTVAVVDGTGANTFRLVIAYGGSTVETSPDLTSPTDAVVWSSLSTYVTITDLASSTAAPNNNAKVVAATPLSAGADDNGSVVESTWTAALTVFPPDLGPGQVSAPGRTTDTAHQELLKHAATCNRTALLDGVDTATAATLLASSTASIAVAGADGSRGALFAPWVKVPGLATGGPLPAPVRSVPPSALAAARIAATDVATQNPNTAAAGNPNGASSFAIGVTQTYSASDRGDLNTAGVNVIRNIGGVVQVYGFRSLSTDPQWIQLNWSRLRMAIQDEGQTIAASIAQFGSIDAKGQLIGRLNGHLAGMLQRYWQVGALYGQSATEAFSVDTSSAVNTLTTAAQGKVLAVLSVRRSAVAEYTQISIVNVPLTQAV